MPQRQIKVLLHIFFSMLVGSLLIMYHFPHFLERLEFPVLSTLPEYMLVVLNCISLILAYMITYSAIEVDSPSLVMILAVAGAGPEGLAKKDFNKLMDNDHLVIPRINDLIVDKMAYKEGDIYKLTPKGMLLANLFSFYRGLLNASKGG